MPLACPVCHEPLSWTTVGPVVCPNGHSFDVAKHGYVHLAPAGHGAGKLTGDTKEMARARQDFLTQGWYDPIANTLAQLVVNEQPNVVLDSGCGTGYYLAKIADFNPAAACIGADVSVPALRIAAKAYPNCRFIVNDITRALTVQDASIDVLTVVFAPRNPAEFARVVRPGGTLIVVVPQPHHLHQLRQFGDLLGIGEEKVPQLKQALEPHFALTQTHTVEHTQTLQRTELQQLIDMTPTAHHSKTFALPDESPLTLAVQIAVFQR